MKKLSLFGIGLISSLTIAQTQVQQNLGPTNPHFCGNHTAQEAVYQYAPNQRQVDSVDQVEFQSFYEDFLNNWSPDERVAYVVPIVVHVVHLNGVENISNTQIYDGIEKLNLDFSMTNPDVGNTVAAFQGIVGNADIEFRLATKDPNGNCHSGITRTYSQTTYDTGLNFGSGNHPIVDAVSAEHGIWPQNKYLNVFICIDPNGAAGYTLNPSGFIPGSSMYGGILLRHDYMGTIGTSSNTARHTLSHETGHWLNLSHNWGSTNDPGLLSNCNGDDGVTDTPNTIGWTTCNLNGTSCGSLDNVQNIMEYSYCSTMFSQGQAARMHTALNSSTGGRNNLWTNTNLIATGTNTPNLSICEVDFSSTNTIICAGSTVNFSDLSYFGVTGRTWSFTGGTPATSVDSASTITYNTPGVYDITLEITDGTNTTSKTVSNYITVLPSPGVALPYTEGFEAITFPDNYNFFVENDDNGETWEVTSTASNGGSKSLKLNNFAANNISKDRFISGPIDISVLDASENLYLTFEYAYKKKNAGDDEWLRVYVSKDCGVTWSLRKNIHGNSLSSDVSASAYTPSSKSEWTKVTIENITSSYYVENFRYKFQFDGEEGNNVYIDDINLYPESWLDNPENTIGNSIQIFPNPTTNSSTINYFSASANVINIELYDMIGNKVSTVYNGNVTTGVNKFEVDLNNLPKGVYIIKTSDSQGAHATKIIKE